ncbi:hypothetical protein RIN67_03165 [Levilactobacillus namurensis]|nr:hypothetical protein [Levilactobacillus namurensis]MDT7019290.1 hypothetical protein [Levilactobacillus namurensis]WNN66109.1 hypothetical protein RIN67_03165 [Levilactobacillus namurensis]
MDIIDSRRIILKGSVPKEAMAVMKPGEIVTWHDLITFPSKYTGLKVLNGQDNTPNDYSSALQNLQVAISGQILRVKPEQSSGLYTRAISMESIQLTYD